MPNTSIHSLSNHVTRLMFRFFFVFRSARNDVVGADENNVSYLMGMVKD